MDIKLNNNEEICQEELINKILVVSAIVAATAFSSAQLRAFSIGWSCRDIIQFVAVFCIIILAIKRKKIKAHHKALFLIASYSTGAIAGVYTLGMLAGAIFMFPTAAVVMSVFYSVKTTLIYITLSLIFCCFIAFRFCSNLVLLTFSADILMANYSHWFVYIVCIGFFFAVMYATIYNYRKTMRMMIDEISIQRDELRKSNDELFNASKNIKILSGLLPICSSCKKIRDDKGYWSQLEFYIKENSEANFSHSICPDCIKLFYPEEYEFVKDK